MSSTPVRSIDSNDLNYIERDVIRMVREALQLDLTPRLVWFLRTQQAMRELEAEMAGKRCCHKWPHAGAGRHVDRPRVAA